GHAARSRAALAGRLRRVPGAPGETARMRYVCAEEVRRKERAAMVRAWRVGALVCAVAGTSVLAVACGGSSNSSSGGGGGGGGGGQITIGLITKTDTNPFFVKMK